MSDDRYADQDTSWERDMEVEAASGWAVDSVSLLSWEEVSGRGDPAQRFRIYRLRASTLELVATCGTEAAVGVTLCTLAREGEWEAATVGVLDSLGEKGQKWIVSPFERRK